MSKTYYAVYLGVNGPISVELEGETEREAIAWAEDREYSDDGESWYDQARTDLEDALDVSLEAPLGLDSGDARAALEGAGAELARDLGDDWELWSIDTL